MVYTIVLAIILSLTLVVSGETEGDVLTGVQNLVDTLSDIATRDANKDYPTYTNIPRTSFSCEGKLNWGYYADIDTGCQVFHVCETIQSMISFLCPIGSIFNQRHLVCDWWYNFDCNDVVSLFPIRNDFNDPLSSVNEGDQNGFDLSIASSGGNSEHLDSDSIVENNDFEKVQPHKILREGNKSRSKKISKGYLSDATQ